jgi:hypothetical protein
MCHVLIDSLPVSGLREAYEGISEAFKFHIAKQPPALPVGAPRFLVGRVNERVESAPVTIEDEA